MRSNNLLSVFCLLIAPISMVNAAGDDGVYQATQEIRTAKVYTGPFELLPGQISNTDFRGTEIPPGPIAISSFSTDIVEQDPSNPGEYIPVPLTDAYLHHNVMYPQKRYLSDIKGNKAGVGSFSSLSFRLAGGSESRGAQINLPYPFVLTTEEGENFLDASIHIISTRSLTKKETFLCIECPCAEDSYYANGTLKIIADAVAKYGDKFDFPHCSDQLMHERNTACDADKYLGGMLCCEDQAFCLPQYQKAADEGQNQHSTFFLRSILKYTHVMESHRQVKSATCCDVTADPSKAGNIEYDVPKLCEETDELDEHCIHVLQTTQILHAYKRDGEFGMDDRDVDIVQASGHMHVGAIEITISDASSKEVLCRSFPVTGVGRSIGNEKDYVVGMTKCEFNPPRRMKATDMLLVESKYDARKAHTGVMGLFNIFLAEVEEEGTADNKASEAITGSIWLGAVGTFVVGIMAGGALVWLALYKYNPLNRGETTKYAAANTADLGEMEMM